MQKNYLIFLILILSLVLRLLFLDTFPLRVDGDASRFALDGIKAWQDHWPVFATGWYGHANLYFYFVGFFLKIFNNDLLGLRLFSAIGGFLSVFGVYLFIKKLLDEKIALWATFFLAICPFQLVFSRVGTEVIWTTFFASISLFFLLKKNFLSSVISGFFIGLSQYFYPGTRFLPILALLLLFILWRNKILSLNKSLIFLLGLSFGFILIYFPMIKYYLLHPNDYLTRVNLVSVLGSGWLENELKTRSIQEILFKQISNSYLAFQWPVKSSSLAWFYRTPFLDPLAIIFFTLGLLIGVWQIKKWQIQFLFVYLISGIFLAGVMTTTSPTTSRYVILFPAVASFIGMGIERLIKFFPKKISSNLISTLLILLLLLTSLYSYWQHETNDCWKYDFNTQIATYAGRYLEKARLKETDGIYFLGNNYMYYEAIPTLPFLTKKTGDNIFDPIEEFFDKINFSKKRIFFIILPDRERDLKFLEDKLPKGNQKYFYNPKGDFLFWLYVSKSS